MGAPSWPFIAVCPLCCWPGQQPIPGMRTNQGELLLFRVWQKRRAAGLQARSKEGPAVCATAGPEMVRVRASLPCGVPFEYIGAAVGFPSCFLLRARGQDEERGCCGVLTTAPSRAIISILGKRRWRVPGQFCPWRFMMPAVLPIPVPGRNPSGVPLLRF